MTGPFDILAEYNASRAVWVRDAPSGLEAVIVLHDSRLGPSAGGIRTRAYVTQEAGLRDACALARAMTLKCALGGLSAGGGKAVVFDAPGLRRPEAFAALGRAVQALGGAFRTAGDLGTTSEDLRFMAQHTEYVHINEGDLAEAVASGMRSCMEACLMIRGRASFVGLRVGVQGCGAIGEAVCRTLAAEGVQLLVSDVDAQRASRVAKSSGAEVVSPAEFLSLDVDVLAPCAVGGVVTDESVRRIRAWALCGAANNILASPGISKVLMERGVLHVPDMIASAGAVVQGIARTVMGEPEPSGRVEALGRIAEVVLRESLASGRSPHEVAVDRAQAILQNAPATHNKSC